MDETASNSSGCPVPLIHGGILSSSSSGCPLNRGQAQGSLTGTQESLDATNGRALEQENDIVGLSARREASTIPVANPDELPDNQQTAKSSKGATTWLYPSEKMFYDAMKRKGWNPDERDMLHVVEIHNMVNERAWQNVLQWERLHSHHCSYPKLKRFQGRPKDFSPRALMLNFFGYKLPFDRHDWYVDRCGQEVRYVIDFYSADTKISGTPAAMYLDVRPALDTPGAFMDRLRMGIIKMLQVW